MLRDLPQFVDALPVMCPSARCTRGALLLGIVQADGSVAIASQALTVTDEFVAKTAAQPVPAEERFRFASPCQRGLCKQWQNGACQIVELAIIRGGDGPPPISCAIRDQCRWHLQRGPEACRVCPELITDAPENQQLFSP
jgi:hypothetical protein